MNHGYSQTNIQLYNQLLRGGYSALDVSRARAAHDLAISLFGGLFRANGKPFISHLIGTASILAAQKASLTIVSAGLLHAAYLQGMFPDPRRGITDSKRKRVRSVVGEETEDLIARYSDLRWNRSNIEDLCKRASSMEVAERDPILIRLANEFEDHLDLGMQYCDKTSSYASGARGAAILCELAESMGLTDLAKELASALLPAEELNIPAALVTQKKSSFNVDRPLSWSAVRWIYDRQRGTRRALRGIIQRAKSSYT